MLKALLLAFVSGIFFFFLILQSAWWLIPGVLTWTAIFVWQDHRDNARPKGKGIQAKGIRAKGEGCDRGKTRDEVLPKVSRPQ